MGKFEIKDDFYINEDKIKIISGALHYFRVVPEYWRDRLEKLKTLGCNTVETYIPWNIHEPKKGEFDFTGSKDVVKFVKLAEELGFLVILRPSPYICAEWEFGGLPAWLLKDDTMRVRSNHEGYLKAVDDYYAELFKHIAPLQITNGGPVIMMQVENEYGSFGNSKTYLKTIKDLMIKHGTTVPLFTSDGAWEEALEAGTIMNEGVFPTANFGSRSIEQMGNLKEFIKKGPLMCMEFWIGWFDNWGGEHKRRDPEDATKEFDDLLKLGHANVYMYHGGTNFGFMNGCSLHGEIDPQTTSYDYDALLTEWGDITSKYEGFKSVISKYREIPEVQFSTTIKKVNLGEVKLTRKVSLFNTLDTLSKPVYSENTLNMEKLDQNYGYILYRSNLGKKRDLEKFKIVSADDRVQLFVNQNHITTQYQTTLGENIPISLDKENDNIVDILVENVGRINYGAKLVSTSQRKGIKDGVMVDIHYHSGWNHYSLELNNIENIDFSLGYKENTPAFYEYTFNISEDNMGDTFLNLEGFGKGSAFINNFNLGRFWEIGPVNYLYIPAPLLKKGENKIIIFETEGKYADIIKLQDTPSYSK
ncbi:beta-galactosidase [Clostridium cavendishii DSM 21758]|uniref:Beta-galactosidase n=1 Tax=Clostridium cavendishii DSM 21758 TaxID=1121302 RepID=A0A1M6URD7_9CLOT|nr:beta-galactosidase family protein [Clostridium cavendishii]SHK71731.1 beta-galactosidase [Clostridium cavendishii DSM 21758]